MRKVTPAHHAILCFALLAAIVVPTAAYASSYWSSLSFAREFSGSTRSYDGSNAGISMTASAVPTPITYFYVDLYRYHNPIWKDHIGWASFARNGYSSANWTNVGSGNYYFRFSKADDGVTVSSSNVHMYSY